MSRLQLEASAFWWRGRVLVSVLRDEDLHFGECLTFLSPKSVTHAFSAVLRDGVRTYAFTSQDDLLAFLDTTNGALPCANPCPPKETSK